MINIEGKDILYKIEYSLRMVFYVTKDHEVYEVYYEDNVILYTFHYKNCWNFEDDEMEKFLKDSSNVYKYYED